VRAWWVGLLFMCLCWAGARAAALPAILSLPAAQAHVALAAPPPGTLWRWVDATAQASWTRARAAAAQGHFTAVGPSLHSEGFSAAAHWYVVRLHRAPSAPARWVLAIGAPYLNDVQVWQQAPSGALLRHVQMGDRFLQQGRPLRTRLHAVGIDLPEDADTLLWVRVHSTSALNVSLDLWQPDAFLEHELRVSSAWGLALGLLGLTLLTQLLYGAWLRDRVMLYYGAFMATLLLSWLGIGGMALLIWPGAPWWFADAVTGGGTLASMGMGNLFTRQVLEMPQRFPRLARGFQAAALLAFGAMPVAVTDGYRVLAGVFDLWVFVCEGITFWVAWTLWRRTGERLHLVYLVAAACFAVGACTGVIAVLGWGREHAWVQHVFAASTLTYLFIMLLAMGLRVSRLRTDRLLAIERVAEQRRFVAVLTHEFRNPLASIDRSANLLQRMPDLSPPQTAKRLAGMRQQVQRLNTLVDSFLAADTGRSSRLRHPQPARGPVAAFLAELHQALDEHSRARLTIEVSPPALEATFDPALLRLALHNLIDNALRYSPEDQPVALHASHDALAGALLLTVRDHGPGLSSDELRHIGTPYFRGTAALGKQGTGLGYHFCREIVEALGGNLEALAAQPQGLLVRLRLPRPA
jgi:signal transduction histidine kinase